MPVLQSESPTVIVKRAMMAAEAGEARLESLEADTEEGKRARLIYDQARRAVLSSLDWNFARRREAGVPLIAGQTPPGLAYAFKKPTDCLRVIEVFDGTSRRPFAVEQEIYTDAAAVQIVFAKDVVNATIFPAVFAAALEALLSAKLISAYGRSMNRRQQFLQEFQAAMDQAAIEEGHEQGPLSAYDDGPFVNVVHNPFTLGGG